MTFWCRIKQSQIRSLSNQFKVRCFPTKTPSLINQSLPISTTGAVSAVEKNQSWFLFKNSSQFGNNVRFFAAPVQHLKPKQDNVEATGPRLNEEITATYVRLVTDEGHGVIPRLEALYRAQTLKLDLVEVQRDAKPPVCKIMDYHKEKYQKELKEKERAKHKSGESLKSGIVKEVRISGKIEQKDLQMKANSVKRLVERGYRVKCMAVGAEDEDLAGLLSKIAVLIEDFSVVESGPLVERRQAYVLVRHAKFGPTKKGGKQKKIIVPPSTFNSSTETSTHSENDLDEEKSNVGGETEEVSEEKTPALENRHKTEPVNRYKTGPANSAPPTGQMNANRPDSRNSTRLDPLSKPEVESPAPENRYKTAPPPNRYRTGSENGPRQMNANRPDPRNSPRLDPLSKPEVESPAPENRYRTGPAPNRYKENGPRLGNGPRRPDLRNPIRPEPPFDRQRQFDSNTHPPSRYGDTRVNGFRGTSPPDFGSFAPPSANTEPQRQTGPEEVNRYRRGPNPTSPPPYVQGNGPRR